MDKKSKITIIISIIGLALVLITVTYAYFAANITGIESASTISLNAGTMSIAYSEGDGAITANNMFPREEAWVTKTFTLTGNNTTNQPMQYEVKLNVISNTFPDDYLTYDLTMVSSTSGTPIADKSDIPINGTGDIRIGTGSFVNAVNDTHNYELKIYFKDNGLDQSDAQGAVFNARIMISEYLDPTPAGWRTAKNGTLLAGIKSNYESLSTTGTIPGQEASASGPIVMTVTNLCGESSDCVVYYYPTQEDAYGGVNGSSGNYSTVYNQLEGKWILTDDIAYYVTNANSSSITYTNNSRVLTKETNLLLSTEDDYGTSYYYRGEVTNNYIVFADRCWRIVRVDGLGNIKITLYNKTKNTSNPCSESLDGIKMAFPNTSYFNDNYNSNRYVGYMYDNSGTTYETQHANNIRSRILNFLRTWYDSSFTSDEKDVLADVIWCNDKRVVSDTTYNPENWSRVAGTGTSTYKTYYQATSRIYPYDQSTGNYNTKFATPSLKCGTGQEDNKISKFTSADTVNGNGALNGYKIGLLTADEVVFAGAVANGTNTSYYLHKNASDDYYLLSPYGYNGSNALVWIITNGGTLKKGGVRLIYFVRPTVSLNSNVTITGGTGTQSNPFVVAT